jgi:hypothetical protein
VKRPAALATASLVAVVAASCGLVAPSAPRPLATAEPPVIQQPELGAVDRRIASIDARALLHDQAEGAGCRAWTLSGGVGGTDSVTSTQSFTCPRVDRSRDVWFELADAWEAAIREAGGQISSTASTLSEGDAPLERTWVIHGDRSAGTSHLAGFNSADGLTLILTLDLVAAR